jgi:hypothetical protein
VGEGQGHELGHAGRFDRGVALPVDPGKSHSGQEEEIVKDIERRIEHELGWPVRPASDGDIGLIGALRDKPWPATRPSGGR